MTPRANPAARRWRDVMTNTQVEQSLLRRLNEAGGQLLFRPLDISVTALRNFEVGVVAPLLALQDKQHVVIDMGSLELIRLIGGRVRVTAVAAELTDIGRETLP